MILERVLLKLSYNTEYIIARRSLVQIGVAEAMLLCVGKLLGFVVYNKCECVNVCSEAYVVSRCPSRTSPKGGNL